MNQWAARIMGLILLLVFMMLFLNLKKQLVKMQQMQNPSGTATAPKR